MRALARDPNDRFQRADEFLEALLPFAGTPTGRSRTSGTANPMTERTVDASLRASTVRRRPWLWFVLGATVGASILAKVGNVSRPDAGSHAPVAPEDPKPREGGELAPTTVKAAAPPTASFMPSTPTLHSAIPGSSNARPVQPKRPELRSEQRPRPNASGAEKPGTLGVTFDAVSPYTVRARPSP